LLDSLYGQVMRVRRRRMERRPQRQRHLAKPVISVGNLSMGGTGKTPVVAAIAQWLVDAGQRPSILSRGYGREDAIDGVVVVDASTPVSQSGDEPLMLARQVRGATVCVSPDRYLGGVLAEKLGCTVHLLDDGFQHIELARDLDILVTTIGEIPNGRVIPMGRLREPKDAAARAHFLVVSDATAGAASAEAWSLGISQSCGGRRALGAPAPVTGSGFRVPGLVPGSVSGLVLSGSSVLALAGIANPERFVRSLRDATYNVVDSVTFPDHHRYTARDLAAIEAKMRSAGADAVFTTEKDGVRFESLAPSFPLYRVPLVVEFDPPAALFESVKAVLR
jgi:tetraacyldisaccharide 4'-kinase